VSIPLDGMLQAPETCYAGLKVSRPGVILEIGSLGFRMELPIYGGSD
jgi:hypothetical protein